MTPRERDFLAAVERLTSGGVPPTYTALMDELGLASKSGVHRLVVSLTDQGFLHKRWRKTQSIEVVREFGPSDSQLGAMCDDALRKLLARVEREAERRAEAAA